MWFISLFKDCQRRFVAFMTQLVSGAMTKDAARRPIRNLRRHETCCDFSLLTGHPSRPLLSGPALGDPRGRLTLQYKRGKRRSGPPISPPCFLIVCAGSSGTWKDKQNTELGAKFVLFPNEVQPSEAKHHSSSSGRRRPQANVCLPPPPPPVFSFSLSLSYRLQAPKQRLNDFNSQEENISRSDPVLFCFLPPFPSNFVFIYFFLFLKFLLCLAQNEYVSLPACLMAIGNLGYFWLSCGATQRGAKFPLLIYAALCHKPPTYPYRNSAPTQLCHWLDKLLACV